MKHILEDLLVVSSNYLSLIKEMKETVSDDLSAHYTDLKLSELILTRRKHQRKMNPHLLINRKNWVKLT